jgi:CheY-like chemotaxis protein
MQSKNTTSILVVEDDSGVRSTVAMVFRLHGYVVETAIDGFDALERMRLKVPDILFSDLNMPQMSGYELLSVVRRRFPEVKVIATSGAYDGPRVPSGIIADAYYAKGRSSAEELLELVEEIACMDVPIRDDSRAPVWIARNGRDHSGRPFVVMHCTECLRSFPFTVETQPSGDLLSTPCIYCPHEIRYIIDFSRSIDSPERRANWKAAFLQSQQGKIRAQSVADQAAIADVRHEMDRPHVVRSVRRNG